MPIDKTSPENWFINKPFTSGNQITPFIDGQDYMADLYNTLLETGNNPGDFIYVTGWLVSLNQCLLGQPLDEADELSSNFINLLIQKATKDTNPVEVKMLPWFPTGIAQVPLKDNTEQHTGLLLKSYEVDNPKFQVCLSPNKLGGASHHQKNIIIKKGSEYIAYHGGIDIASDRWDTHMHDNNSKRNKVDFWGWHDIHTKIIGRSVSELYGNFKQRWNAMESISDSSTISENEFAAIKPTLFKDGIDIDLNILRGKLPNGSARGMFVFNYKLPAYNKIDTDDTIYNAIGAQVPHPNGLHIQVLRTIGIGSTYSIAKENSIETGFIKAIVNAEHYIYLEDQYFWYSRALIDAFKTAASKGVKIIAVTVKQSDASSKGEWINQRTDHHRAWMLNLRLINEAGISIHNGRSVFLYELDPLIVNPARAGSRLRESSENAELFDKEFQIYVHSKLMIIDDRFVSIGSANLNDRSMTTDTEISVSIVDSVLFTGVMKDNNAFSKNTFAYNLRVQIWNKLMNFDNSDISNPLSRLTEISTEFLPTRWPGCYSEYNFPNNFINKHMIRYREISIGQAAYDLMNVDENGSPNNSPTFSKIMSPYNP